MKYFTRTFRVNWSEANAIGEVHLSTYFKYVVETAWEWGAAIGLGIADSEELGIGWLVRATELNLYRPLRPNDVFELTIWLADWHRVHGTRYFELVMQGSGELVAQGAQEVVSVDLKTMHPATVPAHIIDNIKIDNPRVVEQQKFPKLTAPRETAFATQRTVNWQDLDSQEHVNNTHYIAFAEDAFTTALATAGWTPARFKAEDLAISNKRVHVQYLAPATWGETLNIYTYLTELHPAGGVWYVKTEHRSDRKPIVQCVIEWALVSRTDGEQRDLPESLFDVLKVSIAIAENPAG
ncbi:acyl-CoA thioesterase [bacterium]|nr:acyl-CoA thioesterase [bacterium]